MREKIDFTDDSVIVTGGAGGIGGEIVREFASEGANVVVADIDVEGGEALVEELDGKADGHVRFVETDVSDYDACRVCVEGTVDTFGGIDVLVNAATSRQFPRSERFMPFVDQSPEHWDGLIGVSFRGMVNMAHLVLPHMISAGEGSVVNISSESRRGIGNLSAGDTQASTMYTAVKEGIVGFTSGIATEVGSHGVRVNAVSPGTIRTQETASMLEKFEDDVVKSIPMGRVGEPEDTAYMVLFLASDAAGWVTGQTVSVNGGFL